MSTISYDEDQATGFSPGQTVLMFVAVEGALLSGVAILFLVCLKIVHAARRSRRSRRAQASTQGRSEDACDSSLFLSLMAGEMIRSVAAAMSLRWVLNGGLVNNNFCRAQGYLKLIGTNAIDFTTAMITVQTGIVLILRCKVPGHIERYLAALGWLIVVLITTITYATHPKDLMGPTGYWCWITVKYKTSQIMAEYIWMWIIGVFTAIVYVTAALILRGNLNLHGEPGKPRWVWHTTGSSIPSHFPSTGAENNEQREVRSMANRLLWYPVVYLVCITPQSFGRWFFFSGYPVPYEFTLLARTLFSLSGLFNVILFFKTRYHLITGGPSTESIATPTSSIGKQISLTDGSLLPMNSMGHEENSDGQGRPVASSSTREASSSRTPRRGGEEEIVEDYGLAPL